DPDTARRTPGAARACRNYPFRHRPRKIGSPRTPPWCVSGTLSRNLFREPLATRADVRRGCRDRTRRTTSPGGRPAPHGRRPDLLATAAADAGNRPGARDNLTPACAGAQKPRHSSGAKCAKSTTPVLLATASEGPEP